jgi:hypothetical protein
MGKATPMSMTFTLKLSDAVSPCASSAVQCTVVVPTGNVEPDDGKQDKNLIGTPTGLDAETLKVTTSPAGLIVNLTSSGGTVIVGGTL